jgi:hypothetical protein
MARYPEIPELLEQYMEESGSTACWVTVREIRAYFNLDEAAGPALSGFLHKIFQGPFFACRYKVTRIDKFEDTVPPYRIICKYYIMERPSRRKTRKSTGQKAPQKIR